MKRTVKHPVRNKDLTSREPVTSVFTSGGKFKIDIKFHCILQTVQLEVDLFFCFVSFDSGKVVKSNSKKHRL